MPTAAAAAAAAVPYKDGQPPPTPPESPESEAKSPGEEGSASDAGAARLRALQRAVHREIRERQQPPQRGGGGGTGKRKREGDGEEGEEQDEEARRRGAVLRGLDFLFQLALHRAHFVSFGADVIMTLLDLGAQAEDEAIRRAALQRAELLGRMWHRAFPTLGTIARKKQEGLRNGGGAAVQGDEGWAMGRMGEEGMEGRLVGLEEDGGEVDEEEDDDAEPDKDDINTAIRGLCVLTQLGLSTGKLATDVKEYLEGGALKPKDFFRFDPRVAAKHQQSRQFARHTQRSSDDDDDDDDDERPLSPYLPKDRPAFALAEAIDVSFYAGRAGVDLGAAAEEVIPLLAEFRPYQTCEELGWDDWEDQLVLATNTVHVCSSSGELRLQPALFPDEYDLLRRPETFHWPMEENDSHLVGDVCHCLGIFGVAPPQKSEAAKEAAMDAGDDAEGEGRAAARRLLAKGRAFLLSKQGDDGAWPVRDGTADAYDRYLSTASAVGGLLSLRPQGFGPANAALADILRRVNTVGKGWGGKGTGDGKGKKAGKGGPTNSSTDDKPAPPSVACCGRRRPLVLKRFDRLASLYSARAAAGGVGGGDAVEVLSHRDGVEEYLVAGTPARTLADPGVGAMAAAALDGLLHWRRGPGGGRRVVVPSPPSVTSASSADAQKQKAQAVARVVAASRGLDRDTFERELTAYTAASTASAGLPPPAERPPVRVPLSTWQVDLLHLFQVVGARGGYRHLGGLEVWQGIAAKDLSIPASVLDRARRLKDLYHRHLVGFEEWWAEEHEARGKRRAFATALREQRARAAVAVVGEGEGRMSVDGRPVVAEWEEVEESTSFGNGGGGLDV